MEKLPAYQVFGMTLVINFDEREVETEDGGTQYVYTTAKMCKTSTRDQRIEAIIKTRYPTYGAEFAAMHKTGPAADEYMAFREKAKQLATESFTVGR